MKRPILYVCGHTRQHLQSLLSIRYWSIFSQEEDGWKQHKHSCGAELILRPAMKIRGLTGTDTGPYDSAPLGRNRAQAQRGPVENQFRPGAPVCLSAGMLGPEYKQQTQVHTGKTQCITGTALRSTAFSYTCEVYSLLYVTELFSQKLSWTVQLYYQQTGINHFLNTTRLRRAFLPVSASCLPEFGQAAPWPHVLKTIYLFWSKAMTYIYSIHCMNTDIKNNILFLLWNEFDTLDFALQVPSGYIIIRLQI